MKQNGLWAAPAVALLVSGLLSQGCSDESNSLPAGGSFVGSTAAGILAAPQGPFPRGTATGALAPNPATVGPELTIVSPARGAQVTAQLVPVLVSATDPDGVVEVRILGTLATLAGTEYSAQVALVPGINVIDVEATDSVGNRTTAYVSVAHGLFLPDDQIRDQTIGISMTQGGLDRLTTIAEQQTTTLNLYSLISTGGPLLQSTLLTVNATGMQHDPLQFDILGAPSGVQVVVDIDNLVLSAVVDPIALAPTQANITADRATITASATISQSAYTSGGVGKRALGLKIDSIDVTMDNFAIRTSSGALNFVLSPFRGILENLVRNTLRDMLLDIIDQELSKSLVALDVPLGISIPSFDATSPPMDLDLMVQVDEATGAAGVGLGISAGFQVTPTTPKPGVTREVLLTGQTIQAQVTGPEAFGVSLSADAANAFLHALYATGALKIELDGTQPQAAGGISLNVGMLYPFIPQTRELAPDPLTPIVIVAELGSAPIVQLGQSPTQPYGASVGEAELSVWIDYMDGGARLELFTIAAAVDVGADIQVVNNEIRITNLDLSRVRMDMIREPATDLADQEIEDFLNSVTPTLASQFVGQIPALPIPGLPMGLQLTNARIEAQPNLLSVHGDL